MVGNAVPVNLAYAIAKQIMADLNEYRQAIDDIDEKIMALYRQRMQIAREVALYKSERNMEIFDPDREKEMLDQLEDPGAKQLLQLLMDLSKLEQKRVVDEGERGHDARR